MLLAVRYIQNLDPLNSPFFSTIVAALPVLVLFYLLVVRRWRASLAGLSGALVAILIAWSVYKMPLDMTCWSCVHGIGYGLLPICWTVFNAMLLYNVTVESGQFENVRRSVAGLSSDGRIQAVLIGFCFGAFLEGSAGSGAPVAVCGAMLVGLGFPALTAAVICLIANTSPVAYGGVATPIITLAGVTDIPGDLISVMAAHQLPFLSFLVPCYMVKVMCSWRETLAVWPALVVGGGSFAIFQFGFGTIHRYIPGLIVWPITDVGASIGSLVSLIIFLKLWKPKKEWHFEGSSQFAEGSHLKPLTMAQISKAWMPFVIMALFLIFNSQIRVLENQKKTTIANFEIAGQVIPFKTVYEIEIPTLHREVERAARLQKPGLAEPEKEAAIFKFIWLSAAGTPVFMAAVVSMLLLRMNWRQGKAVFWKTCEQMKIPIPTIACMLGLSYVTKYAGMDATLGVAFARTGWLYPYFAAMLGWLGVFLTGTDAGSNALFGSLQKITADELFKTNVFTHLTLPQAEILISTANSTGGVMGKMIDAQSICVATAGTHQLGKEADIFKKVIWHSIILGSIVGLMTMLQAYVYPFTLMVPK
ncbi:L-lactate permease [Telmatocola sphagniphila]|uniref:L-lactate permease n=1 Tax=Telmatocola sphagniphila TaxID=1123043 RepID=A0A8E6EUW1_9BACT|nr:L-lactate permease [Telmatocola sphagniphila]QVL31807.1 L-lactate permease [Telmatocola sphagniphila]